MNKMKQTIKLEDWTIKALIETTTYFSWLNTSKYVKIVVLVNISSAISTIQANMIAEESKCWH
jgi:hypothetical protein